MSKPTTQTESSVEVTEGEILLEHVAGTGENGGAPPDSSSQKQPLPSRKCLASISQRITSRWPFCQDREHRRLAIYSVICGLSCVGVTALIYSVKARERRQTDPEKAQQYSDKARCRALVAIALGIAFPVFLVLLVIFASYLLTLID